jgi:hypothetical protein
VVADRDWGKFPNGRQNWEIVDAIYSYQCSIGFASGQIPYRSQGTLLPLSVRIQGIESVEQCATQGFNLVKQGKLSLKNQIASNLRDHQENTSNLIY